MNFVKFCKKLFYNNLISFTRSTIPAIIIVARITRFTRGKNAKNTNDSNSSNKIGRAHV